VLLARITRIIAGILKYGFISTHLSVDIPTAALAEAVMVVE